MSDVILSSDIEIQPGDTHQLTTRYRGSRFTPRSVVVNVPVEHFTVKDFMVGCNSQLSYEEYAAGGISATSLSGVVVDPILDGRDVTIMVTNVGTVPRPFKMTISEAG